MDRQINMQANKSTWKLVVPSAQAAGQTATQPGSVIPDVEMSCLTQNYGKRSNMDNRQAGNSSTTRNMLLVPKDNQTQLSFPRLGGKMLPEEDDQSPPKCIHGV